MEEEQVTAYAQRNRTKLLEVGADLAKRTYAVDNLPEFEILDPNEVVFCVVFAQHGNASAAARAAFPQLKHPRMKGYNLRKQPRIRAALDALYRTYRIGSHEAEARLAQAATWSWEDLLTNIADEGEAPVLRFDWAKIKQSGALHLIEDMEYDKAGRIKRIVMPNRVRILIELAKRGHEREMAEQRRQEFEGRLGAALGLLEDAMIMEEDETIDNRDLLTG